MLKVIELLLCKVDPYNLTIAGAPNDEYDVEANSILSIALKKIGDERVVDEVRDVFNKSFVQPMSEDKLSKLFEGIKAIMSKYNNFPHES